MTITCSIWARNVSKFAAVKIFNPSGSSASSLVSVSSGTLSTLLVLKKSQ